MNVQNCRYFKFCRTLSSYISEQRATYNVLDLHALLDGRHSVIHGWLWYFSCLHPLYFVTKQLYHLVNTYEFVGLWMGYWSLDSSVGVATRYGSGDRIPVKARFSAPVQTDPGAHPASFTMGTGSFPGGKAAGAWRKAPTLSSAEVKGKAELYSYFYSPSGPSWPVLR
jgi:hypothetical protein